MGPSYARMGAERGQNDPWTTELVARGRGQRRTELALGRLGRAVAWRDRALMALLKAGWPAGHDTFDGRAIEARVGMTVAAALAAAGITAFRPRGEVRHAACSAAWAPARTVWSKSMGEANQRACMVRIDRPSPCAARVSRRNSRPATAEPRTVVQRAALRDVLVIGGGAGGLTAAAVAAEAGARWCWSTSDRRWRPVLQAAIGSPDPGSTTRSSQPDAGSSRGRKGAGVTVVEGDGMGAFAAAADRGARRPGRRTIGRGSSWSPPAPSSARCPSPAGPCRA